jgi:hypothetical protein
LKQELDFIVIGAQRSGTTSLFEYMRTHPGLCIPSAKEMPYFSHERHRESWEDYMRKAFAFADPGCRWGTVTPQYMVGGLQWPDPDAGGDWGDPRAVPARIRERLPEARLIAILRDPVQRARSHHAWALSAGWERRPFDEAIRDLLSPEALIRARARPEESTGYVVWGEYGRILSGYYELFPPEQILVLYTCELADAPSAAIRRVFAFLGVAEDYVPDNLGTVYRPSAIVDRRFPRLRLDQMQAAAAGNRAARRLWHGIPAPARRHVEGWLNRLHYRVDTWNRSYPRDEFPHAPTSARDCAARNAGDEQALRTHYQADGRLLTSMLGAPPPWLQQEREEGDHSSPEARRGDLSS